MLFLCLQGCFLSTMFSRWASSPPGSSGAFTFLGYGMCGHASEAPSSHPYPGRTTGNPSQVTRASVPCLFLCLYPHAQLWSECGTQNLQECNIVQQQKNQTETGVPEELHLIVWKTGAEREGGKKGVQHGAQAPQKQT